MPTLELLVQHKDDKQINSTVMVEVIPDLVQIYLEHIDYHVHKNRWRTYRMPIDTTTFVYEFNRKNGNLQEMLAYHGALADRIKNGWTKEFVDFSNRHTFPTEFNAAFAYRVAKRVYAEIRNKQQTSGFIAEKDELSFFMKVLFINKFNYNFISLFIF